MKSLKRFGNLIDNRVNGIDGETSGRKNPLVNPITI